MIKKLSAVICLVFMTFNTPYAGVVSDEDISLHEEIICLAKNIYFEAGNESKEGQIAVGQVTLNRARSDNYPDTVCGVVYQKFKKTCQFSWVCKKPNAQVHDSAWETTYNLAKKLLLGEVKSNKINSKTLFFHNHEVVPKWASVYKRQAIIGGHVFYSKR
jgi:spore germination cell wall hydrolase CwlJ-like protein